MALRSLGIGALGRALTLAATPAVRRFERALEDPAAAQADVLRDVTRDLGRTAYGRALGVREGPLDPRAFVERVPIATYEDMAPWIERQMQEEGPVLVRDEVLFYERTSGSSGAAKYVPYTRALRRSFTRMFLLWAHDLLTRGVRLRTGMTYFSVSPAFPVETMTAQGTRIGLEDDTEYLSGWLRHAMKPFFAAPPDLKKIRDPFSWKRALAGALLAADRLEIVSVWSPSFFLALLEFIDEHRTTLLADLVRAGRSRRSAELAGSRTPAEWWPELKLVSCWASASAAPLAARLASLFPQAIVQGKGLLATEAPITIPRVGASGYLPLATEVYLELEDDAGCVRPLAALDAKDAGTTFSLLVSQRGGLLRYRIGDRVTVTGVHRRLACLDFVGRAGDVCDLVGEKLNETFVARVLSELPLPESTYCLLVPASSDVARRYVLFVDRDAPPGTAARADAALSEAHHYRVARLLGQLDEVVVRTLPRARERWQEVLLRRGMKLGDIKDRALVTNEEDARQLLATAAHTEGG